MITVIPRGNVKSDDEHRELYNQDYYAAEGDIIIRKPDEYEKECSYIIEYKTLPFPSREAETDPTDIYQVDLKSVEADKIVQEVDEFEAEEFTFQHTDFRLTKIYIQEKSKPLSRLFRVNHDRDYQIQPRDEILRHEKEQERLENLSLLARYEKHSLVENTNDNSKRSFDIDELAPEHRREVSPASIESERVQKGPENRVPVLKGVLLHEPNNKFSIREVEDTASKIFGVTDNTAENYVKKLVEWCDDVRVKIGTVYID